MHKNLLLLLLIPTFTAACPTCIGLPRLNERPFFERKSFLAALQQPGKKQQPQDAKKDSTNNAQTKAQP